MTTVDIIHDELRSEENVARGPITTIQGLVSESDLDMLVLGSLERILVGHLLDQEIRVYAPFTVLFKYDEGHVVAEAPAFNEFGFGDDHRDALHDLQRALAELYRELEEKQDRLGPDLLTTWQSLRRCFSRHS